MAKPFVLYALRILGLEEMLKLSEVLHVKQVPLKKAAGEELIVWSDEAPQKHIHADKKEEQEEAKVLPFKRNQSEFQPLGEAPPANSEGKSDDGEPTPGLFPSELVLWQRELTKDSSAPLNKQEAQKGYRKSNEMYVVKSTDLDGKEKIRFASTKGILVNKKQA